MTANIVAPSLSASNRMRRNSLEGLTLDESGATTEPRLTGRGLKRRHRVTTGACMKSEAFHLISLLQPGAVCAAV